MSRYTFSAEVGTSRYPFLQMRKLRSGITESRLSGSSVPVLGQSLLWMSYVSVYPSL